MLFFPCLLNCSSDSWCVLVSIFFWQTCVSLLPLWFMFNLSLLPVYDPGFVRTQSALLAQSRVQTNNCAQTHMSHPLHWPSVWAKTLLQKELLLIYSTLKELWKCNEVLHFFLKPKRPKSDCCCPSQAACAHLRPIPASCAAFSLIIKQGEAEVASPGHHNTLAIQRTCGSAGRDEASGPEIRAAMWKRFSTRLNIQHRQLQLQLWLRLCGIRPVD